MTDVITQESVKTKCDALYVTKAGDKELTFQCGQAYDHSGLCQFMITWDKRDALQKER